MNKTCTSPEADRLVYQTLRNVTNMAHYREQRQQLELLKSKLAKIVMQQHTMKNVDHVAGAIFSGQRLLHTGASLADAITHCDELLKVENA